MAELDRIENSENSGRRVRHRLGIVGLPGFSPVPHLLMMHQHALKLTSAELNVYLNIFMHWYDAGRLPFPRSDTIAQRMGTSQRNVQRLINNLVKKGMILRMPGEKKRDPKQYDVKPLLLKLQHRAKEWAANRGQPIQDLSDVL